MTRSLWLMVAGSALALALAFLFSGLLWRELRAVREVRLRPRRRAAWKRSGA
jgi:hypothetical protein